MANDEEGELHEVVGATMTSTDSETSIGATANATETDEPNANRSAPTANGPAQTQAMSTSIQMENPILPEADESTSYDTSAPPNELSPTGSISLTQPLDGKEKQTSSLAGNPQEVNTNALEPSTGSLTTTEVSTSVTPSASSTTAIPLQKESPQEVPPPPAKKRKLCGVCNDNDGKYNCVSCSLPFCSITCLNTHKPTHPNLPPKPSSLPKKPTAPIQSSTPRPGTLSASTAPSPFAVLDDSPQLKLLFKKYPNLANVLNNIHDSTLRPVPLDDLSPPTQSPNRSPNQTRKSHGGRNNGKAWYIQSGPRRRREPWTYDRGMQIGRDALHVLKNTDDDDGEAIREYCELVLLLLGGEEERAERAAELVQKEVMQENVAMIKKLLEIEQQQR